MTKNELNIKLPKIDELFTTQAERDDEKLEKIVDIKISEIDDFPQHPFQVRMDEDMEFLKNSIQEKGVLMPAIVRKKSDGRYEMISGHRRKAASELANLDTLPCVVRNLSDDEAVIIMVDSNLQREKVLFSEKAFAYKMKMEALSHQGKKSSRQIDDKLLSADLLGKEQGESGRTVQRYIRLTYLLPELLAYVDNSIIKDNDKLRIAMSQGVELSFLTLEEQKCLLDYIDCYQITPSQSQAISLKEMSQNNSFTVEKMKKLLDEEKPNQTPSLKVSMNKLKSILPKSLKNDREREDYVIKAVIFYDRYQKKQKEKQGQVR